MKLTLKNIRAFISISRGNSKLGYIPNISLPPVEACLAGVPCAVEGCYALLYYKWPTVKNAWDKNFRTFRNDPNLYFQAIDSWLAIKRPYYFRWHVSGDILNPQYLDGMKQLASSHKAKFLAFTKRFDLDFSQLPTNLNIIFSMWPGVDTLATDMPLAWVDDPRENRIPAEAFTCMDDCAVCGFTCWHLKSGESVVFKKK